MNQDLPIKDIIEWDVANWSQLIKIWGPLIERLPRDAKILAIGERNGGLTLWLALMGFNVVCSEREASFDSARHLHQRYNVAHRVTYMALDVVYTGMPANAYDLIIAKSVIGGLKTNPSDPTTRNFDVQRKAVNNIYTLLAPGGCFLSAENLTGSFIIQMLRMISGKNKGWRYLTNDELHLLFQNYTDVKVQTFGILPSGTRFTVLNRFNFFLNNTVFRFFPSSAKYIAFTTARK